MQLAAQFSAIQSGCVVDATDGVIRGVSVITEGEASGHGLWIDGTTLKQVLETASAYAGGLKVKVNHGKALESIVGVLKNFVIDGQQLRADLHLLKSANESGKIIEMAQTMPESFGLSISFSNKPEEIEGKKFARCAEIYSADLVDSPAANPSGLFSKTNNDKIMDDKTPTAPSVAELAAEIANIKKLVEAQKPTDLSTVTAEIEAAKTELARLTSAANAAAEAAKKTEIAALVAEASRDGKVVPLTDVQLSKMEIADIKEMITKLPKAQVALAKKPVVSTDKDGNELTMHSKDIVDFCKTKRAEGAAALNEMFKAHMTLN